MCKCQKTTVGRDQTIRHMLLLPHFLYTLIVTIDRIKNQTNIIVYVANSEPRK